MVLEDGSCEKDRRLVGREFHRRGEELRKKRSENLSLDVRGGRERETEVVRGASFTSRCHVDEIT